MSNEPPLCGGVVLFNVGRSLSAEFGKQAEFAERQMKESSLVAQTGYLDRSGGRTRK